jgi:sulfopyruvate decarboxylase TPP-binding subunit
MTGHIPATDWADGVHTLFTTHRVDLISFVPDGGHKRLIALCQADSAMRTVTLTTEEEGIALAAGAFLGGRRAALLMQSSGVGNCSTSHSGARWAARRWSGSG